MNNKTMQADFLAVFAGKNEHESLALIKLLKYISRKYFKGFRLLDESEYWATGDAELCRYFFDEYGKAMDDPRAMH